MNKFLIAILIISALLASACTRAPSATAPEVTAEIKSQEETAPAAAPEADASEKEPALPAEQKKKGENKKSALAPEYTKGNTAIVSEKTILGSAANAQNKEEKTSWFSNVVCGKLFADGESLVLFTLENKGKSDYYLSKVGLQELTEKNGLIIHLNSDRVLTDGTKECGTDMLKPGQKTTCTVKTKLRKGKSYWERELLNKLTASTVGVYTELKFTCEGIAETPAAK